MLMSAGQDDNGPLSPGACSMTRRRSDMTRDVRDGSSDRFLMLSNQT